MDPTLTALVELLLKAVPTILFLIFLTLYLKVVFFKPLERVLAKRREETEGARELAEKAFAAAEQKASQFDQALANARMELYREQEAQRREWLNAQAQQVAEARKDAEQRIEQARRELAAEVDRATAELANEVQELSRRMIAGMTSRRAA